ncbi:MAG TPA: hypothetical protein VFZ34_13350 [Blastocatellia bacterium]|nr:hypothetical protein [Blastocatellia bacterium]
MTSVSPTTIGNEAAEITRTEKEQELERILHSGIVREKTVLHTLLRYLGQHALEPHDTPLKEYTIGVEALGKPAGYDPRLDPTVRVEIGKLRSRLIEYYQQHPEDALRLEIPKGSYDVTFTRIPHSAVETEAPISVPPLPQNRQRWLSGGGLLGASALLAVAAGLLFFALRDGGREPRTTALPAELQTFWQPYLRADKPTLLVYSTPLFVRLDQFVYRDPLLNQAQEIEKDQKTDKVLDALSSTSKRPAYKYTGVGEAEGIFLLTQLLSAQQVPLSLKRSANISWEDLKGRQVILLGSPKNSPQFQGLPYQPKFDLRGEHIVNQRPAADEPHEYRNVHKEQFDEAVEAFALISVYQGLDSNTRLVILSCAANEGIAGAAEYVTRADKLGELFQHMKLAAGAALPAAFQFIIKVRLNDRVPVQLSYVTHHLLTK